MLKRLPSDISKLLIPGICNVFRPVVGNAPLPAWMYIALGLLARYATICPAEFVRAVTPEPRLGFPEGLVIVRSPAVSPLRFESTALCAVASSPVSAL